MRWFVGLDIDDPVWGGTTFAKTRDRLLAGEIATRFLAMVLAQPKVTRLLSSQHFSVDGTLLEAWVSTKSIRPKDGPGPPPCAGGSGEQDFQGQKRSNDTHASTTDCDARLYKKGQGKEAKLRLTERWLGKFGQSDRWISCLTAAMLPRIRSEHDEANTTDA